METIKISKYPVFIASLFFLDFVISEVYTVGDESGWNSGTGTDFLAWSEKHNFTVGDVLGLILISQYSSNFTKKIIVNFAKSLTVVIIFGAQNLSTPKSNIM